MEVLLLAWADGEPSEGEEADFQAWADYEKKLHEADVLVAGSALGPTLESTLVDPDADSEETATQPSGESQVRGFYVLEVESREDGLKWAHEMPLHGRVEVRFALEFD